MNIYNNQIKKNHEILTFYLSSIVVTVFPRLTVYLKAMVTVSSMFIV